MTTPKYEIGARVRVKANIDIFAGLVGTVVGYDADKPRMPYVVHEDGVDPRRERYFAEDEIERAPIETVVVEGVVAMHYDDYNFIEAAIVGDIRVDTFVYDATEEGDEVRVIVEVLKRAKEA